MLSAEATNFLRFFACSDQQRWWLQDYCDWSRLLLLLLPVVDAWIEQQDIYCKIHSSKTSSNIRKSL